ncbi:WD40-repeat-containing domain protein [Hyaloraphidium curvatum]|nr:WD40-repeat-containing domain protein [Hyaloraphidium curvatum]
MSSARKKAVVQGDAGKAKTRASHQQLAPSTEKRRVPPGQWQLSDKELDEDVTCILNADKPKLASCMVQFNHLERVFRPVPRAENDHGEVHFLLESYVDFLEGHASAPTAAAVPVVEGTAVEASEANTESEGGRADGHVRRGNEHNYFNFTDRAAQTLHYGTRDRFCLTDAVELCEFGSSANQWIIHDAYEGELLAKEKQAKERDRGRVAGNSASDASSRPQTAVSEDAQHSGSLQAALPKFKILERMVNQPLHGDIDFDFRYWQTPLPSDPNLKGGLVLVRRAANDGRPGADLGLLPLWKFRSAAQVPNQPVTAVCWSSKYPDLLAIGYGSFDYLAPTAGKAACYSLKNATNPEYAFDVPKGVTSVALHKTHSHLLAVGSSDGSIAVFDMRAPRDPPLCSADVGKDKTVHVSVAQVRWHPKDTLTGEPRLYSASNNGTIQLWNLTRNGLVEEHVIALFHGTADDGRPTTTATQGSDIHSSKAAVGDAVRSAMTSCLDLRPQNNRIFLVGTEEGSIIRCDRGYNSQQLGTVEAHHLAVNAVHFNQRCPVLFASAGSDWKVKIWKEGASKPLLAFDLGSPVLDVAWSPHRASILAAVTGSGKLCIFDLLSRTDRPVLEQQVIRKNQLTKVAFNPASSVLALGDGRGLVFTFKLPNHLHEFPPGMDADNDSLEEEARKRKERLAKLRASLKPDDNAASPSAPEVPPPAPEDGEPEENSRKRAASPDVVRTLEAEVESFAKEALDKDTGKKTEVDLLDLAPRKPNWDLKRDLDRKLAKLERRTDLAIAELIRDRLKQDGNATSNNAASYEALDRLERQDEEDD